MRDVPVGPRPPIPAHTAAQWLRQGAARCAILVEGWSDQAAVEALARRRGLDLDAQGIGVVPMGGITNLGAFIDALNSRQLKLRLAGLCDAAEEAYLVRTLRRAGLPVDAADDAQRLGFFVCNADLEDELIRAQGICAVENVLESEGELRSFRRFQDQPAQRGRETHAQLRRFMGTRARRKIRYATLLVEALSLDSVPRPLDQVLAHASR